MSIGTLYTLNEAQRLTGENRTLITFLITDRKIPYQVVGKAKVLDAEGFAMLCDALAHYRNKVAAQPVASA